MQRRTYIAGVGTALATGIAGCSTLDSNDGDGGGDDNSSDDGADSSPSDGDDGDEQNDDGSREDPGDPELVNGSFEAGLDGWTLGTYLPTNPGDTSVPVDHGVELRSGNASDGAMAVQFYISGVADDGTIWVEQPVDLSGVSTVELDAYSEQQSFNEIAMVAFFAGEKPEGGLEEADFDREEHVEDHEGWKTYSYDVVDVDGTGTLAVGMNVIWETKVQRLFDDVRLVEADS